MDYPQNSHRSKEEQPKPAEERKQVTKVVTGTVKTKKKNGFSKMIDLFITEDAPKIKEYAINDILRPGVEKFLIGAIRMIFKGDSAPDYDSGYSSTPRVRYSKCSEEPMRRSAPGTVPAKNRFEYDDIEFPSRGSAERVLSSMQDIYAEFKSVTLAEMYELSGLEHPYTYTRYGWSSLSGVDIIRRGDGYFIKLPPATLLTN